MGAVSILANLCLINRKQRYKNLVVVEPKSGRLFWETGAGKVLDNGQYRLYVYKKSDDFRNIFRTELVRTLGWKGEFETLDRIEFLLALLSWPGPDREMTGNLELENSDEEAGNRKRNPYRSRPVLPDPKAVENLANRNSDNK